MSECISCGDDWTVARGLCDTCYRRARRKGLIQPIRVSRPVTVAEVELMRALRAQGLTIAAVAEAVGRGVATVHRHTA